MQRYFSKTLIDGYFKLDESDLYHIKTVMRMHHGDQVEVVYQNQVYLSCIENVNGLYRIRQLEKVEQGIQKIPEIILAIPLLKEAKMDFIIQKATELGVHKIVPVRMARSVVKLDPAKESKKLERWRKIAKEASEQSKRVTIPEITKVSKLASLEQMDALKLVCSTISTENNLPNLLQTHKTCDRILVVIGPEGGLSMDEEELLIQIGFHPVRLGNNIMRVETVPIFFLSVINYEYME